jgi:hypothetical protein
LRAMSRPAVVLAVEAGQGEVVSLWPTAMILPSGCRTTEWARSSRPPKSTPAPAVPEGRVEDPVGVIAEHGEIGVVGDSRPTTGDDLPRVAG